MNFRTRSKAFLVVLAGMAGHSGPVHAQPLSDHVFGQGFDRHAPVLYPADRIHSPISESMVFQWRNHAARGPGLDNDIFAKTGDTKLVSSNALDCFAGNSVDLGANATLQGTLDYFLGGDADGSTPFDRSSLATEVGRSASWLVSGSPSPLEDEFSAISPRFTLIAFGENDISLMNLDLFANSLWEASIYLLERGSIPVIFSLVPCQNCTGDASDVDLYRRIARATAQYLQIPFVDLYRALDPLTDDGLGGDGVNMNVYNTGTSQPCILTSPGLQFGYNTFNLLSLQALDRLRQALIVESDVPDPDAPTRNGTGSLADPVVVSDFPYGDGENLSEVLHDDVTSFSGCPEDGATQGSEMVFQMEFDSSTNLQVDLVSRDGSDLDMWLFENDTSGPNCVAYANKSLAEVVAAGTWYLVVEAFDDKGSLLSGEFVISIDRL